MKKKYLIDRLLYYSYQLEMALTNEDNMNDFLEDKEIWFEEIKQVLDEAAGMIEYEESQQNSDQQEQVIYNLNHSLVSGEVICETK